MIRKNVENTILKNNLIEKNQHIVLGLSGGPDSVCLFYLLKDIAPDMNLTIHAVHINHQLRPGAADEDQRYVESLCQREGVECFCHIIDCEGMAREESITCEEAGRKARYEAFAKACDTLVQRGVKREDIRIAVAHNKEDQAETILFRIMRGTGTDGLAGMAYSRRDRYGNTIIRPLLDTSRQDIESYCKDHDITPQIDKTNEEPLYTRNKIRLGLIPYIQENFNKNIVDGLSRLGRIAAEDSDYLWTQAKELYRKATVGKLTFNLETLRNENRAITHRLYSMALERLGLDENISMAHLEAIDGLVYERNARPSAMVILPKGIKVSKQYDRLSFIQEDEEKVRWKATVVTREEYDSMEKTSPWGAFDLEKINEEYHITEELKDYHDAEKILELIQLRTRRDGDLLKTNRGTKRLQDFFVDEKVPRMFRDSISLTSFGGDVLWIMPSSHFTREILKEKGRFCGKFLVENQSKWILLIEKCVDLC